MGGREDWRLLGRSRNHCVKFDGAGTAWETRKQSLTEGGSNMLRVGKWKTTSEGTWEKSRVYTSTGEGREGVGPHRILPTPQRAYQPTSYQKAVLPSASPPPAPTTPLNLPDPGLPAIWEGWPQQLLEAYHCRGCPCPGLLALWRGCTPAEQHQTLPAPKKRPGAQKS